MLSGIERRTRRAWQNRTPMPRCAAVLAWEYLTLSGPVPPGCSHPAGAHGLSRLPGISEHPPPIRAPRCPHKCREPHGKLEPQTLGTDSWRRSSPFYRDRATQTTNRRMWRSAVQIHLRALLHPREGIARRLVSSRRNLLSWGNQSGGSPSIMPPGFSDASWPALPISTAKHLRSRSGSPSHAFCSRW